MAPECLRRTQLSEVGWQYIPHSWSGDTECSVSELTSRPSCRRRDRSRRRWKKHVCASWVTCWYIDSSPSIRSRTTVTGWMTLWPTLMTLRNTFHTARKILSIRFAKASERRNYFLSAVVFTDTVRNVAAWLFYFGLNLWLKTFITWLLKYMFCTLQK